MSQFHPYPEYGDEKVQLLGRLPEGWKATPVKVLGDLGGGAGFPHDEQGIDDEAVEFHKVNALGTADTHGYLCRSENTISETTATRLRARIFPEETIVFAKVGAALLLSRFRRLRRSACLDNNMMGFEVAASHSPAFVRYALGTLPMSYVVNPGAVPSVNEGGIGALRLPGPPLSEQTQIARFLDYETAKIDRLIEKQQQLIAVLKEKRQAVISHAVTKGLNPAAPMKDSGVEWLREVPAHWGVRRLKRISEKLQGRLIVQPHRFFADEGVPIVFGYNIKNGRIDESGVSKITYEADRQYRHAKAKAGDVYTVRLGDPGATAVVPPSLDGCHFASIMWIHQHPRFASEWLAHCMNSDVVQHQIEAVNYGAAQTQFNISDAVNFVLPFPPLAEQVEIASFLDRAIARNETLIARAENLNVLLQERRTALISAAVTGKIDVRGWRPPEGADNEKEVA